MDKFSENIFKKAIKQAIVNSVKKNIWPPPRPSFLTNYLVKPMGKFIDLWIKEVNGKIIVFFKLENYKKPKELNIEKIFNQGVFWTAFFDVDHYRDISVNPIKFDNLAISDKAIFLEKYLK